MSKSNLIDKLDLEILKLLSRNSKNNTPDKKQDLFITRIRIYNLC